MQSRLYFLIRLLSRHTFKIAHCISCLGRKVAEAFNKNRKWQMEHKQEGTDPKDKVWQEASLNIHLHYDLVYVYLYTPAFHLLCLLKQHNTVLGNKNKNKCSLKKEKAGSSNQKHTNSSSSGSVKNNHPPSRPNVC